MALAAIPLGLKALSSLAGGIAGYQKGGLKGALIGGGLGAIAPGAVRMAGTALGGKLAPGVLSGLSGKVGNVGLQTTLGASQLPAGFGLQTAAKGLGGGITNIGTNLATAGGLGTALGTGYALAGAPGAGMVAGGLTGGVNRGISGVSGIAGYDAVQPDYGQIPAGAYGGAVPPGLGQYGGTNMYGSNPYDVIDPSGPMSANRLMQLKQAQLNAKMLDTIAGTQMKWTEETKRRDLERQLAAAGIRQNILTQSGMLRDANQAGLNQGTNAMQQVGSALTNNYSYS
tara:strand:- start:384 stop:1238 length:855 start_codon:yes stop_codon:yes gene_type:complete